MIAASSDSRCARTSRRRAGAPTGARKQSRAPAVDSEAQPIGSCAIGGAGAGPVIRVRRRTWTAAELRHDRACTLQREFALKDGKGIHPHRGGYITQAIVAEGAKVRCAL